MRKFNPARHAFTLIELLVVISIIALLIGILLPALGAARSSARLTACLANLRSMGQAAYSFAADHKGHVPGTGGYVPSGPLQFGIDKDWKTAWSFAFPEGQNPRNIALDFQAGNRTATEVLDDGTLWDYTSQASEVYRCPSLNYEPGFNGSGSNGLLDYSMPIDFGGALTDNLPLEAIHRPNSGSALDQDTVRAPLFVEEDPAFSMNQTSPDAGHSGGDWTGTWHKGNVSNIATTDGGAITLNPSDSGATLTRPNGEVVNAYRGSNWVARRVNSAGSLGALPASSDLGNGWAAITTAAPPPSSGEPFYLWGVWNQ
jgi:prepilin-type N-terminal cleavage/methylation domain-containing protein